jgi:hypothetical protein
MAPSLENKLVFLLGCWEVSGATPGTGGRTSCALTWITQQGRRSNYLIYFFNFWPLRPICWEICEVSSEMLRKWTIQSHLVPKKDTFCWGFSVSCCSLLIDGNIDKIKRTNIPKSRAFDVNCRFMSVSI